jgi:hypothetical protein
LEKQFVQSTSTDAGKIMVVKPVPSNVVASIRCNFERSSNVTDESDLQVEKQFAQSTSTDAGIIMAVKPLPLNAVASIRCDFEADSNNPMKVTCHWKNSLYRGLQHMQE